MSKKFTNKIQRETLIRYKGKRPICFKADGIAVSLWEKGRHARFSIDWGSIYETAMKMAYIRSLQDKAKKKGKGA